MRVPNLVHFVFGLAPQTEPFHLIHYLAIESCRRVLGPEQILFHHGELPYGVYWDLVRPHLTLLPVRQVPEVLTADYRQGLVPDEYRYAHHADFVRVDALIEHGGVYADMDTIFVRPYPPELYEQPFVIGREADVPDELTGVKRPSLCNALLMAEPGSAYARTWRAEMAGALNGTWSNHSGFLAHELTERLPATVHVEPDSSFFYYSPFTDGLARLFERSETIPDDCYSIHLWAHLWWRADRLDYSIFHAGLLTPERIRTLDSTYNMLARPLLPELTLW
jgi:hypothetical protein